MSASRAPRVAWLLAGLSACTVPSYELAEPKPTVVNSCEVDTQCSPGACVGGMCVLSYSSQVQSIIVEVVPPASAHFGGGDSFLLDLDVASGANPRDLAIPPYAMVTGKVVVAVEGSVCAEDRGSDGSLPVHVTASRSNTRPGLPAYSAEANAELEGAGFKYHLSLPPAFYDLYLTFAAGCPMPPILLRNQDFTKGAEYVWPTTVTSMQSVKGTLKFSNPETPEGWSLELIEPLGGKTISTTWPIPAPPSEFDYYSIQALNYVAFADSTDVPLLKLSPPKGAVAPSVLWDLSVIDLDNDGTVGLDITQLKWSTTTVRARVVSASNDAGIVGATVNLKSTGLADAPDGLSAMFETTVMSGADGVIEANLVPGTYKVVVIPPDASSAVRQEMWTVAATPPVQAGRTVHIEPAIPVSGVIREPLSGSALGSVLIELSPWGANPTVIESLLGAAVVLPRRVTGTSASDGSFAIGVDFGSFLLAGRTDEATGFPWVVRTGIEVKSEAIALGELRPTYPLVVSGTLLDWSPRPVQRALIRAYLPLTANGVGAKKGEAMRGSMQMAETRSDGSGRYKLLLPGELRP